MKNKINPQVQTHIDAIKLKIIDSINQTNWVEYENNIQKSLEIFKDSVNRSISPNSSIVIKELFSFLIQVNFIHLDNYDFDKSMKLVSDIYNIYFQRDRSNEVDSVIDVFMPNALLNDFIKKLYNRIHPNDFKNFRELVNTLPLIEYLIELIKLFNFEDINFNSTISYFVEAIFNNTRLSYDDKLNILIRTMKKIDQYTIPLLSEIGLKNKKFDQIKCNNFYIQEFSTILRLCYLRNYIVLFQKIFSLKNESYATTATIQNENFKQITSIALMFIITDQTHDFEYKKEFIHSKISSFHHTKNLIDFLKSSYPNHNCNEEIWSSYFNMTALSRKWKDRVNGLTTFDHSPEIFYILYLVFYIKSSCYSELFLNFPMKIGQADRFDIISQNFINHFNGKKDKIINDFILAFEIKLDEEYKNLVISNLKEIVPKLDDAIKIMIENQKKEK